MAGAVAWADARLAELGLARCGEATQPHVTAWSTVLRLPTADGQVWLKANEPALAHEAALVELLAGLDPHLVPPLLAREPELGWMLQRDAGGTVRALADEGPWLAAWADVLPRYAALQVASAPYVDRMLALGVPDLRLGRVPQQYADLVGRLDLAPRFAEATPLVGELCERLAAYGVPDAVQHDDLHDAQMFLRDGRHVLLDWADACVTHPFLSLSVALEGVLSWGLSDEEGAVDVGPFRDAYLAVWEEALGRDLAGSVPLALRLGWAVRAVNGHVPGDDAATRARLGMFLDGRP